MPPFVCAVCCFFSAWLEAAGCLLTHTSYLQGSLECEALHAFCLFVCFFFLMAHVISYQQELSELTRQRLKGGAEINFTIPVIFAFFVNIREVGVVGAGLTDQSSFKVPITVQV